MKRTTFQTAAIVCLAIACAGLAAAASSPDFAALVPSGFDWSALAMAGGAGTTFSEGNYAGEHMVSEASGTRSRDVVTLASGNLVAGTVLGKIRGAASSAAVGTNVGNGVMGAVTLGAGAMEGDYKLVIVEAAANAGAFVLENPLGAVVGHGNVASAFSGGGLSFTLADGATDFSAGDTFKITVAAGTTYAAFNQDATDGTEVAAAILFDAVDASAAAKPAVVHARDCEVQATKLTWPADIDSGEKTVGLAQLTALGIIAR